MRRNFEHNTWEKLFRKKYYIILQHIFQFNKWHTATIYEREYAMWLSKKVNEILAGGSHGQIIEVGCGLGDILSEIHVQNHQKKGYDIEKNVIRALKFAHPGLCGKVGSFNSIKNQTIDILIAVNWLHTLNDDWFRHNTAYVVKHNHINRIIVDTVPAPPYEYSHDYISFFEKHGYALETKSRGFRCMGVMRHILIFKKV